MPNAHHSSSDDSVTFYKQLLEAITAVSTSLDSIEILTKLAETLTKSFSVSSAYICDLQLEKNKTTVLAHYYIPEANPLEKKSVIGESFDLRLELDQDVNELSDIYPIVIQVDSPKLSDIDRAHIEKYGGKTVLIVPLVAQKQVIGFAELWESRTAREFTVEEIALCQRIAQQATTTLLNAKLFEAEAKRRQEAETLRQVTGFLSSTLDLDEVLNRTVEAICHYMTDIQNCILTVLQDDGRTLHSRYVWNEKPEYDVLPLGSLLTVDAAPFCRLSLKKQEPVSIVDLRQASFLSEQGIQLKNTGLCSLLYVPLIVHSRPVGMLHLHVWHQPRLFTKDEISLVQGVANQAAIAIENANLYAMQQKQLKLSQMLQKVGSLLTVSLSLETVYSYIFDYLSEIIPYDAVSLHLENPFSGKIEFVAGRGFEDIKVSQHQVNKYADIWMHRIPIPPGWAVVPNTHTDPDWVKFGDNDNIASWAGATLMINDQLIGVLNVDSKKPDQYDAAVGRTIAAFANQAAVAIVNARLHDQVSQQADELAILHQISIATAVTVELDELLFRTTEMITNRLYPDMFGFVMIDEHNGNLFPHPSFHGIPETYLNKPILYESVIGLVAQTGEAKIIPDVSQETLYQYGMPIETSASAIYIPVKLNEFRVGVICAESPEKNAFSEKDLNFLITLAGKVAVALERARLYEALLDQKNTLASEVDRQTIALQSQRDQTLAILENAGEGIVLTDADAKILYVNPIMEQMSGYLKEELMGESLEIFLQQRASQVVFQPVLNSMLKQERWSGEMLNERKDGSTYSVTVTTTSIKDRFSNISGYVSVQSDITRLKEVERLKAEFISNISHELRTPLTNIKTYVSLLSRGKEENFPRYFNVIHVEIERLNRLIQDMLDVSRLDAEFVPNPKSSTNLLPMLKELYDFFLESISEKSIDFTFQPLEIEDLKINMAQTHLRKVLESVIDNAILYVNENGRVIVTVKAEHQLNRDFVLVQIEDNGPGIIEEEEVRIFDRFYRGVNARSGNIPGTGLGLAVTKTIVERYGGVVELDTSSEVGARFKLWLPKYE